MCHGGSGEGGIGPALAGNTHLQDDEHAGTTLLAGAGGMLNFSFLSDAQLAAVATHIRTNFGNDFGWVSASQFAQHRL